MPSLQAGAAPETEAFMAGLQNAVEYKPTVPIAQGDKSLPKFYSDYYQV